MTNYFRSSYRWLLRLYSKIKSWVLRTYRKMTSKNGSNAAPIISSNATDNELIIDTIRMDDITNMAIDGTVMSIADITKLAQPYSGTQLVRYGDIFLSRRVLYIAMKDNAMSPGGTRDWLVLDKLLLNDTYQQVDEKYGTTISAKYCEMLGVKSLPQWRPPKRNTGRTIRTMVPRRPLHG